MTWMWRSRWLGGVSAWVPGTADERGGMMTGGGRPGCLHTWRHQREFDVGPRRSHFVRSDIGVRAHDVSGS